MPATRCARGPSLGAATLAARGKTQAAFGRRSIAPEPLRFAPFFVAFRSKYTRASSPGGGSSLTRLVGRAPRPHREDWPTSALTWVSPQAASRGNGARNPNQEGSAAGYGAPIFRPPPGELAGIAAHGAAKLPSPTAKKRGDGQERRCSHRHRAGARNPHRWRCVIPCPSSACAHPGWRDHPSLPSPRRRGRRKRHPRVAPGGAGPVTSRAGTRGRRTTSSSRRPARPI